MSRNLYNTTSRKGKEVFFYVARITGNKVSLMFQSDEAQYWRILKNLESWIEQGVFDSVFVKGKIFVERVERIDKSDCTKINLFMIRETIRRNFGAITWDELGDIIHKGKTVEDFLLDSDVDAEDDYYLLQKKMELKAMTKEEYFFEVVTDRFPYLSRKLTKEHKKLGTALEML